MCRSVRFVPLFVLTAIILIAGIAATPAQLPTPAAPTVQATGNAGEIVISWNPVPGAQYYTVGWINWTEGQQLLDAGQDWFSLFHYATVLGTETSYTVKGLDGGDNYHANVRATDVAGTVGRLGGGWSPLSAWSIPAVQPAGHAWGGVLSG